MKWISSAYMPTGWPKMKCSKCSAQNEVLYWENPDLNYLEQIPKPLAMMLVKSQSQNHFFSPPCSTNTKIHFYPILKVSGQKTVARLVLLSNIFKYTRTRHTRQWDGAEVLGHTKETINTRTLPLQRHLTVAHAHLSNWKIF